MKRIALSLIGLSLAAAALAPATAAMPMNRPVEYRTEYGLDAFDLAYFAYQGNLMDEGIPSYLDLVASVDSGQIQAEDLVQAAIESGELSASAMNDDSFEQEVSEILSSLSNRVN